MIMYGKLKRVFTCDVLRFIETVENFIFIKMLIDHFIDNFKVYQFIYHSFTPYTVFCISRKLPKMKNIFP